LPPLGLALIVVERVAGGQAATPGHVVMKVMDAMEGDMNGFNWNSLIQALVLVRIGQELGTESRLARALHDVVHALVSVWQ
jgi:hypothetical protein